MLESICWSFWRMALEISGSSYSSFSSTFSSLFKHFSRSWSVFFIWEQILFFAFFCFSPSYSIFTASALGAGVFYCTEYYIHACISDYFHVDARTFLCRFLAATSRWARHLRQSAQPSLSLALSLSLSLSLSFSLYGCVASGRLCSGLPHLSMSDYLCNLIGYLQCLVDTSVGLSLICCSILFLLSADSEACRTRCCMDFLFLEKESIYIRIVSVFLYPAFLFLHAVVLF